MPMRDSYITARFLGIISAGDFTSPARDLVRSREIDLFYISKDKIIKAFKSCKLIMDYPDKSSEEMKRKIADKFEKGFTRHKKRRVVKSLIDLLGQATVDSYVDRVRSKLSASPQEVRFILRNDSEPIIFNNLYEAAKFLKEPKFKFDNPQESYLYQVVYSDGSDYENAVKSIKDLEKLHKQILALAEHMNRL